MNGLIANPASRRAIGRETRVRWQRNFDGGELMFAAGGFVPIAAGAEACKYNQWEDRARLTTATPNVATKPASRLNKQEKRCH